MYIEKPLLLGILIVMFIPQLIFMRPDLEDLRLTYFLLYLAVSAQDINLALLSTILIVANYCI